MAERKTVNITKESWEFLRSWAEKEGITIAQVVDQLLWAATPETPPSNEDRLIGVLDKVGGIIDKLDELHRQMMARELLNTVGITGKQERQRHEDVLLAKTLLEVLRRNTTVLADNSILALEFVLSHMGRS